MNDLISRKDAINAIGALSDTIFKNIEKGATYPPRAWFAGMANAESIIKALPSVDAVQHGRWLQKPNIFGVAYCSECDYELHTDDTNYCPACGAKMETGADT